MRHELLDAGWRGRTLTRHLALIVPVCAVFAALPGDLWIRLVVPAFALVASTFLVVLSADQIRAARLRQHGLPVPRDPPR